MSTDPSRKKRPGAAGRAKALTTREKDFCRHYNQLGNGTQAAIAAGVSPRSAKTTAERWLKKPLIRQEVERLRRDRGSVVEQMLTNATKNLDPSIVADELQEAAAVIASAYTHAQVEAGQIKAFRACIGEIPIDVTRVIFHRGKKDQPPHFETVELKTYTFDPVGAARLAEQLHERINLREGSKVPGGTGADTELAARLDAFRSRDD